ncbi:ECF transporter S component [Streptomyces shenzhenensis]
MEHGVAAGVVTMVSPAGPLILVMMAFFGALTELPFLITRYRWFGPRTLFFAGLGLGVLSYAIARALRRAGIGSSRRRTTGV